VWYICVNFIDKKNIEKKIILLNVYHVRRYTSLIDSGLFLEEEKMDLYSGFVYIVDYRNKNSKHLFVNYQRSLLIIIMCKQNII